MSTDTDQPIIDDATIGQPLGTDSPAPGARSAAHSIREDLGKKLNDPTAVYVAIGASDLVAAQARKVAATAARQGAELADRARSWNSSAAVDATDVPRLVLSRALKVAGQVETVYADLASRGRDIAERAREGAGGNELVRRAVATLTRRTDVVTTAPGAVVVGETVEGGETVEAPDSRLDAADGTPVDAPDGTPVDVNVDAPLDAPEAPDAAVVDTGIGDQQSSTGHSH